MKVCVRQTLLAIAATLLCVGVQAGSSAVGHDEIILKNGSRLLGKIIESRDEVLTIETDFAGTLSVKMDQIESVSAQEPVIVLMQDKTVYRAASLHIKNEKLVVDDGGKAYSLDQIGIVNPQPWELGQGYRWNGNLGFAFAIERGNTDSDELDIKFESIWRSTRDRYTLRWNSAQDESNGVKTEDNWQGTAKYDYFLKDPNYIGAQVYAEKDKFQDLDLRVMVGPYYGRQLYAQPVFSLSSEVGVSYVTEEYNIAEDDDYVAGTWNLHASSDYLGGDSKLYFDQTGIWNLEDTSNVVINSTFGLSFPLVWNFDAAAEVLLKYDSGSVEDVDDLDQTYQLRVGYTWQ